MSIFCSLAISKNNFGNILLPWNDATYQFLQVTHNKMQFVCKKNKI